ncbi:hypothetical protein LOY37_13930 [Pseudomonas sp. B21-012]|uniref:hypothetical protein n=1 Tax=Pseudomonas sp. B21-012 TaxID=2895472 RepID=UPI00215F7BB5|nr:hypothetical protein [Pseudomonas sp. B21-012]UVM53479.1 hypothetical protein LOY37_13930 [Pseudomonas sp. B21-012]
MAKQAINLGAVSSGVGGDTPRAAWTKAIANFDELYTQLGGNTLPAAIPVAKGGTGGTTQATARTGLGLGTAATSNKQASATDATAGALLAVGGFGLGASGGGPAATPNSAYLVGFYKFGAGAAGSPFGDTGGSLLVNSLGGNYIQQIAMTATAGNLPFITARHFSSEGNPGAWVTLYHTGNTIRAADGTLKAI